MRFSWTSCCEAGRRARADNWMDELPIHDIWLIRCSDGFLKEYPDALSGIQVSAHRDQLHRRFLCTHGSREHEPGGVIPSGNDIGISGVKIQVCSGSDTAGWPGFCTLPLKLPHTSHKHHQSFFQVSTTGRKDATWRFPTSPNPGPFDPTTEMNDAIAGLLPLFPGTTTFLSLSASIA